MPIKKRYLKSKPVCKTTFSIVPDVDNAEHVTVVGEFNDWQTNETPMKRNKNGSFTATLDLETDQEYQFRYLVNNAYWMNDSAADKYLSTEFHDAENCVVAV